MAEGVKIPTLTTFPFRLAMSEENQIHKLNNARCQIKSELLHIFTVFLIPVYRFSPLN